MSGKSRDERDHLRLSRRVRHRDVPLVLIEINDGPLVRPEVVFGEG